MTAALTSKEAAVRCGVSRAYWFRLAAKAGLKPVGQGRRDGRKNGKPTQMWDAAAVAGVAATLDRKEPAVVTPPPPPRRKAKTGMWPGANGPLYGLLDAGDVAELARRRAKLAAT